MIFVGDIAIPHKDGVTFLDLPVEFYSKSWFGNLEGAIVNVDNNKIKAVYNHKDAVAELFSKFQFCGVGLANNHIFDTGNYLETKSFLEEKGIKNVGIGTNLNEANNEISIYENGQQIIIVNFGWEVIQCFVTDGNFLGVNPLRKKHVLDTVSKLINDYPDAKVIPYMHWGYELEAEPQPFERELAKKLIDIGAAGIIGCHSHRVGGFELYNNKPILYSLGNWMFKQNHYFNFAHSFPDFCNLQLAFEWDFSQNTFLFHFFKYDRIESSIEFVYTENKNGETINKLTPFAGLSEKEYEVWYRKNHFHKNKGLPIYYWNDSKIKIFIKDKINVLRDNIIQLIIKFR